MDRRVPKHMLGTRWSRLCCRRVAGVHIKALQTGFDNRLEPHRIPAIYPYDQVSRRPLMRIATVRRRREL